MSAMPDTTGSCLCGAVRLELSGEPRFVAHCHCANCRKAHGAGFVTFAGYAEEALTIVDPGARLTCFTQVDTGSTRRFCSRCGTQLLFAGARWAGEVHVALAALDEAPGLPKAHAYADRAPAWCLITDDLPRFGGSEGNEPL